MHSEGQSSGAKPIGRTLRFLVGVALVIVVVPIFSQATLRFVILTGSLLLVLLVFYSVLHYVIWTHLSQLNEWVGALLANAPVVLLYILGVGGGPLFGAGEGQLAAITFVGISLIVAGLKSDAGCEVMSIPGVIFGTQTHLACIAFSPIDWVEREFISRR